MQPYVDSASIYDLVYAKKNYAGEVDTLRRVIAENDGPTSGKLLDVACGTGGHLVHLQDDYECSGLDLSAGLLAVAEQKLPALAFYKGDMRTFDLGKTFDIITCLFSAIGYMQTVDDLHAAIAKMARHLCPGGMLLVEPWFTPDRFLHGHRHADLTQTDEVQVCRMSISNVQGQQSIIDFHHMIMTADGIHTFTETHVMGLFTIEEYLAAFETAGLETTYDIEGPTGRGLYIGRKQTA